MKGIENPILVKISSNEQIVKESSGMENPLEPLWLKSNKFGRAHIGKFTADDHYLFWSKTLILVESINDVPVYYAGSTSSIKLLKYLVIQTLEFRFNFVPNIFIQVAW